MGGMEGLRLLAAPSPPLTSADGGTNRHNIPIAPVHRYQAFAVTGEIVTAHNDDCSKMELPHVRSLERQACLRPVRPSWPKNGVEGIAA